MAPIPDKPNYLPSTAHIFGIGVLQVAITPPDKPRTVFLEAGFWTGQEPVLGLFRYYNDAGIVFERNQKYIIYSTVSFLIVHSVSHTQNDC
jgi:hypothetical protein